MNSLSDLPEQASNAEPAPQPGEKREVSDSFREFEEKLAHLPTPEEKVALGLSYMRSSISQEGTPHFREFWEARKLVLPCFRENINSAIRSQLWNEYVELTVEARRLKEILEEQSAFAMEQIDLAVGALDADLKGFAALLSQAGEIQGLASSIKERASLYNQLQRELNLLNTLASRLNGLRKEVVKTDMRVRFKTKFFKRLSELGDQIFPRRKQLIEQISQQFEQDVEQFITAHFVGDQIVGAPYYALREEIKALQGMAKLFTLSSAVFNRTRLRLSECWDKVKILEKEHRKEIVAKKAASSENRLAVEKRIAELGEKSATLSLNDLNLAIDEILQEMRQIDLHRDDVRALREALAQLKEPHLRAQEEKTRALEEAEKEKLRVKREKLAALKEKMGRALREGVTLDLESLTAAVAEIEAELRAVEAPKVELQWLERQMRQLRDLLAEKKEQSLLSLSEGERQDLENLRTVLRQKKLRRQEIKDQVESYRKMLGSSNLDFEKAMLYRDLLDQERERLEKADAGIEEIEQKIAGLES